MTGGVMADRSVYEFTEKLASGSPTPGGGSAAALVGALGVALGGMVGSLTIGKPRYAGVEEEMKDLIGRAEEIRNALLDCIRKDEEGFGQLLSAYALPKEDPTRTQKIEEGLMASASAPMEIFDLSCKAIGLMDLFAQKGSKMMASDAACGAVIAKAAMLAAAANVRVNTKTMKNRAYALKLNAHIANARIKYSALADMIYQEIDASMDI